MNTFLGGAWEAEAWGKAIGGDPDAFAEIFDAHRDRVFGHSLRLIRSIPDAEDVTALVFLEAWRRRAAVRVVEGSIIGWLLVTANYVVRNHTRSLRRHQVAMRKMPPSPVEEDHADRVLDALETDGRASQMRQAFGQLSAREQDIITLCVFEQQTTAQASEALHIPVGTVKSRLSRAKARLSGLMSTSSSSTHTLPEGSLL